MKFVLLPDLHFGPNKNNELIYIALRNIVYPYILNNQVDMIVIAGDDTDDRLSLDQIAARYYLTFTNEIVMFKKCDGNPIPVRWISGTESHQKGQLQSLQYLTCQSNIDVKTYETCGEELFKGINILYVPEESVYNKEEFYKDTVFSNKKYDLCFGHGMFDHIGNNGWGILSEHSLKGSPIWNIKDFKNVYGGVYFGHIHKANFYKNKIYYGGSLSRFCQGEYEDKGFLVIDYNPKTKTSHVEFIINPYAPIYKTIELTKSEIDNTSVESIVENLKSISFNNHIADLRVIIKKEDIDLSKLTILKQYFSQNREFNIRIEIETNKVSNDSITNTSENINPIYKKITNAEDWENNTIAYAKANYGYDINLDEMRDIIIKCEQE